MNKKVCKVCGNKRIVLISVGDGKFKEVPCPKCSKESDGEQKGS